MTKIFYDGTSVEKYQHLVEGFTTNTTFMKHKNYTEFIKEHANILRNRPVSLQIPDDVVQSAISIASIGENIYVKVSVIKPDGSSNMNFIESLVHDHGLKVNITSVFTIEQLDSIFECVGDTDIPLIVSIFAGRISDTGVDPVPIFKYASNMFKSNKNIEILWAGCKEVLSIKHAENSGCHIITIPDSILDRIGRMGKDLTEMSRETVQGFMNDGKFVTI